MRFLRPSAAMVLDVAAGLRRPPRTGSGIFVLGMHRSGTSAITGLLNLLGVTAGADDDLIAADNANHKGYWENAKLTDFQELLLRKLGGSWDRPPVLANGWEKNPRLLRDVGRARRIFRTLYGSSREWAWKDPRTSLLLPFWKRALAAPAVVIIIHRNPLEVARSLNARDGFTKTKSLALWEAYNRSLLRNSRGARSFVVSYENLVADPISVAARIKLFLTASGFTVSDASEPAVALFVDARLRHSSYSAEAVFADADVTPTQRALLKKLRELEGVHDDLDVETDR